MADYLRTLFLHPPSFEGFDGGAVVVVTHRPDAVVGAQAVYALEDGRLRRR